ncbi:hypothetical protein CEXT_377571 [Caerostris extrusa]|uniref:Uncharacterized protein n=1 Tax=Caerostris extrusa TaxID=172846 RepID=A0AAV4WLC1_CAEEX|nr:hypothetical protein CEXT_377571 [Caerostris extrusa]
MILFGFSSTWLFPINSHPDEIKELPGLNFPLNYKHYSGYLNATKGRYLHYWFVESQRSPSTDPCYFMVKWRTWLQLSWSIAK